MFLSLHRCRNGSPPAKRATLDRKALCSTSPGMFLINRRQQTQTLGVLSSIFCKQSSFASDIPVISTSNVVFPSQTCRGCPPPLSRCRWRRMRPPCSRHRRGVSSRLGGGAGPVGEAPRWAPGAARVRLQLRGADGARVRGTPALQVCVQTPRMGWKSNEA